MVSIKITIIIIKGSTIIIIIKAGRKVQFFVMKIMSVIQPSKEDIDYLYH